MAVRLPIQSPTDAIETFVYSMSALAAHYPGRYEDEISGPWPWKFSRTADGYNGVMLNTRITIRQTVARDMGRSWNFADNAQYPIVSRSNNSLGATYPATTGYPVADSRAFLRGAIYSAKAFLAMHSNLFLPVKYFDAGAGINKQRNDPWVLWTEGQLADGNPYVILEGNIPLNPATADTVAAWLAVDLAGLPTPTPAVPANYQAMS